MRIHQGFALILLQLSYLRFIHFLHTVWSVVNKLAKIASWKSRQSQCPFLHDCPKIMETFFPSISMKLVSIASKYFTYFGFCFLYPKKNLYLHIESCFNLLEKFAVSAIVNPGQAKKCFTVHEKDLSKHYQRFFTNRTFSNHYSPIL